jgi:hypothetical protein
MFVHFSPSPRSLPFVQRVRVTGTEKNCEFEEKKTAYFARAGGLLDQICRAEDRKGS